MSRAPQLVDKNVCRKTQGKAEDGNTCLQTPGTCESCPEWANRPKQVSFTVPLVPPSVNHYKMRTRKGVTFVSGEAKAFKQAVAIFGRGQAVEAESYEVSLQIFLGKNGKGDADNFAKCCLDGLVEGGIIRTDAAINKLTIEKTRDWKNPRTEITVKAV